LPLPASVRLCCVAHYARPVVGAVLSIKEPTRIRIEGAPIIDVFGNIHSSQCGGGPAPGGTASITSTPVNPSGEVVLECDRDKGEIYVRPVAGTGDAWGSGKPVNLFISSAHATYTLVLRRADTPADTIVIRDRSLAAATSGGPSAPTALGTSPNHVRAMKALLVAMASDRVPADIRVEEANQHLQLWAEARFSLMRRYEGRGLTGEKCWRNRSSTAPTARQAGRCWAWPSSTTTSGLAKRRTCS
jgi:conjugal transfer pilus assembly protein TraK